MNAREARDIAFKINTDAVESQYADIQKQIENAAKEGKYEAYFFEPLKPDVRDIIEKDGYRVQSFSDQRDGTTITISW